MGSPTPVSPVLSPESVEAEGKERGEEEESHGGSIAEALASPRGSTGMDAPFCNLTGQPHPAMLLGVAGKP